MITQKEITQQQKELHDWILSKSTNTLDDDETTVKQFSAENGIEYRIAYKMISALVFAKELTVTRKLIDSRWTNTYRKAK